MSITLNPNTTLTGEQNPRFQRLAAQLKERLAAREAVASQSELDELRRLISVLDPAGSAAADPFAAAEAAHAGPSADQQARNRLYQKALYAPAPVFLAARAVGALMKLTGK